MKKSVLLVGAAAMMSFMVACGGGQKAEEAAPAAEETKTEAAVPEYKILSDLPTIDITTCPQDKEGRYRCSGCMDHGRWLHQEQRFRCW